MFTSRSHHKNATRPSSHPGMGLGRRKSLALPFVMTAAAACTPRPADEPSTLPAQGPRAEQEEATPVIISNPPRPQPAEAGTTDNDETRAAPPAGTVAPTEPEPVIMRNPPPPRSLPAAPATGGNVQVRADGTCWWQAAVTCPPKTMCNPPPPSQVQCPAAKK